MVSAKIATFVFVFVWVSLFCGVMGRSAPVASVEGIEPLEPVAITDDQGKPVATWKNVAPVAAADELEPVAVAVGAPVAATC